MKSIIRWLHFRWRIFSNLLEFGTFTRMKEYLRIKSKTSLEKTGNIEIAASVVFNGNTITIPTWTHVQNHVQNHIQNHVQHHVQNRVRNLVQNHVQNRVQNRVQNHVRKIKKVCNKNMSFLKITDPKTRDFIVNEFLKTKQNIPQTFLSERVGDLSTQCELSKLF